MGVILKRMMLRAATDVAEALKLPALVTGESVAQVSSQTLPNLSVIDRVTDALVLRPLITMDKGDIIDMSRRIGTETFAAEIPEYCGVISVRPTTSARLHMVEKAEAKFDFSVLEQALADRQVVGIQDLASTVEAELSAPVESVVPPGTVVIDIRHPDEVELKPLSLRDIPVESISLCRPNRRFLTFSPEALYP